MLDITCPSVSIEKERFFKYFLVSMYNVFNCSHHANGQAVSHHQIPPSQNNHGPSQALSDTSDDPNKKKRDRFKGMSEDEVLMRMLPDHLVPNLDIIIVSSGFIYFEFRFKFLWLIYVLPMLILDFIVIAIVIYLLKQDTN